MIHIGRAGNRLGSFSEFEVRQGLASGRFFLSDLGWKEGMENWAPLSDFSEFASAPPMPPLPGEEPALPLEPVEEPGLPWDRRRSTNFFSAFAQTAAIVLLNPGPAFARMLQAGPLSSPLLYSMLGGWVGAIASAVYAVAFSYLQPTPAANLSPMQSLFAVTPERALTELKLFVIVGPILVTVSVLICSALIHLLLMLTGGATRPYHVTLRVFCFSYGTTQLLQFVPMFGPLVAPAWLVVCCVVGLAVAHETSTGRSIVAMILFMVGGFACCLGVFALALGSLGALPHGLNP